MTKAHQLARQLQADNNIKRYHSALSQAMKLLYHNIKIKSQLSNLPQTDLSVIKNGYVRIEFFDGIYENIGAKSSAKRLEKFAYKVIPYFGGTQLFFSNEIINSLK